VTKRSHVTKREAQAVADFATDVCAALHLPGWRILVMDDPADDDNNAEVRTVDGRWVAQVYLSPKWMSLTDDERRDTVVHEVCHLLHARLEDAVLTDSRGYMHDHEHDDWSARVKREFELMADHLALFLADTHTLRQAWDKAHGRG
jgi:hypothetical protein